MTLEERHYIKVCGLALALIALLYYGAYKYTVRYLRRTCCSADICAIQGHHK